MKQIGPFSLCRRLLWVVGLWLLLAGAAADVIVYYSSTSGIRGLNLDTGNESLYTTSPYTSSINALAANTDTGFVYYGAGTTVYYWNPLQGADSAAHHVLDNLATAPLQLPASNLNSGGGTYLNGVYYIAAEQSNGTVTDIFALTMSADGTQIVSGTALNLLTACNCSGVQLGGLGDITAITEAGQTVIYGATTDISGGSGTMSGRWRFVVDTGAFTLLSGGQGGQLSADTAGNVYLTQGNNFHLFNTTTGQAGSIVASVPVLPYDTSAGVTLDYGDAPESYGVAQHSRPDGSVNPYLGTIPPDNELFGQNTSNDASGDDNLAQDDEDAVAVLSAISISDTDYSVSLVCQGNSRVNGWLDLDRNGSFDANERNTNFPVTCSAGTAVLSWSGIQVEGLAGVSFARFRTASNNSEISTAVGHATDGEVEDYPLNITSSTVAGSSCPAGHQSLRYTATDVPMNIGTNSSWTRSTINVPDDVVVTDVNVVGVNVSGVPSSRIIMYLGNSGTYSYLMDYNCSNGSTIFAGFDDEASTGASCPSNGGDSYTPRTSLSRFDDFQSQGDWTLWIYDYQRTNTSRLESWELELCHIPAETPSIGIAKSASVVDRDVSIELVIENIGDVSLDEVQVSDNLDAVFGAGNYLLTSAPQIIQGGANLVLNSAFNGTAGESEILDSTTSNILAVGEQVTIRFDVSVTQVSDVGNGLGVYSNQALVTAQSPLNTVVFDYSDDGSDVDENDNGVAGDANEDDPTPIVLTPVIILSGSVFIDNGIDSPGNDAEPHDGQFEGGETGIANVVVELVDSSDPGSTLSSTVTTANGYYEFELSASQLGSTVEVHAQPRDGLLPISENVTHSVAVAGDVVDNRIVVPIQSLDNIESVDFGRVGILVMTPDHDVTATAGSTVYHAHQLRAASAGEITLSLTDEYSSPARSGWSGLVFEDSNCNGVLQAGEDVLSQSLVIDADSVVSGGNLYCVVVKVFVPSSVPAGALFRYRLSATQIYADPANLLHGQQSTRENTDTTRANASDDGELKLTKRVENITQASGVEVSGQARPGDRLRYAIKFENIGSAAIDQVTINDSTPAFTLLDNSISCPGTLPAGLATCQLATPGTANNTAGYAGEIEWQFNGALQPGASAWVEYIVVVD